MKKTFFLMFFCLFLIGCDSQIEQELIFTEDKIQVYDSENMTVFKTKEPFNFVYQTSNLKSVKTIVEKYGFEFAINGSYFGYTGENNTDYIHAGFLKIGDEIITPVKTGDVNITHFVVYQTGLQNQSDKLFFVPNTGEIFSYSGVIFQVGPLLVSGGVVQYDLIEESSHGSGKHYRTILGIDDMGYKYFIIVKKKLTLLEVIDLVLGNGIVSKSGFSLMNLDGGPSSSYYGFDGKFEFRSDEKLPIIFGVR